MKILNILRITPHVIRSGFLPVLALSTMILALTVVNTFAQQQKRAAKSRSLPTSKRTVKKPVAPNTPQKDVTREESSPVAVVNSTVNDFLSGEISVSVNPKQPTVIRLGLAQNAVSIVEFPASDGIYYIHEGNPRLASVFQSPTKETDRSITIYPGESFLPTRDGGTSAAISLQMRSGLVIILELVPVSDLRKNAHRCVINYDREAVVAARRHAGLAFDLGGETSPDRPVSANTKAISKLVVSPQEPVSGELSVPDGINGTNFKAVSVDMTGWQNRSGKNNSKVKDKKADISSLANKRLAECIKEPKKNFKVWSKPQAGLEIAVSKITEIDESTRLAVVAVRNAAAANLRLAPGSPEIQIQTTDSKGNSLQSSKLDLEYIETTTPDGIIPAGSTVFYAVVYKAPVLGINQSIRLLVAQREAADVPASTVLSNTRPKE